MYFSHTMQAVCQDFEKVDIRITKINRYKKHLFFKFNLFSRELFRMVTLSGRATNALQQLALPRLPPLIYTGSFLLVTKQLMEKNPSYLSFVVYEFLLCILSL